MNIVQSLGLLQALRCGAVPLELVAGDAGFGREHLTNLR